MVDEVGGEAKIVCAGERETESKRQREREREIAREIEGERWKEKKSGARKENKFVCEKYSTYSRVKKSYHQHRLGRWREAES